MLEIRNRRGDSSERITDCVTFSPPDHPGEFEVKEPYGAYARANALEEIIRGDFCRSVRREARIALDILQKRAPALPESLLPVRPSYPNIGGERPANFVGSAAGFDVYRSHNYLSINQGTVDSLQILEIAENREEFSPSGETLTRPEYQEISNCVFGETDQSKSLFPMIVAASGRCRIAATAWQAVKEEAERRGKKHVLKLAETNIKKLGGFALIESRMKSAFSAAKKLIPSLVVTRTNINSNRTIALQFETEQITLIHGSFEIDIGRLLVRLCVIEIGSSYKIEAYLRSLDGGGKRSINGHIHPNAISTDVEFSGSDNVGVGDWHRCCLGQGEEAIAKPLKRGSIDLAIMGMAAWCNTYGSESPHFRLEEWLGRQEQCSVTLRYFPEAEVNHCQCGANYHVELAVSDSRTGVEFCPYCERVCIKCDRVVAANNVSPVDATNCICNYCATELNTAMGAIITERVNQVYRSEIDAN